MWQYPVIIATHPIYNGAKPENPCSVFLGAFSGLLRENDDLPYAALRPTSIRLSRDAKTATPGAGAEKIGVEPLRPPCFPDNDAIFVRGREVARSGKCKGARTPAVNYAQETGTAQPTGKVRETPLLRDDFSIFHYVPVSKIAYSGAWTFRGSSRQLSAAIGTRSRLTPTTEPCLSASSSAPKTVARRDFV